MRNLVVVMLLFVCLTFSLSMLAVKLAADSQTQMVKERVGNYAEIRSSSSYMMSMFEQERGKSAAQRAREARGLTEEQQLEQRTQNMVQEKLTDTFSQQPEILTYDKVLTAGITVSGITNTEMATMLSLRQGIEEQAAAGGISKDTFVFEGNTNGASASEFLNGKKRLVSGSFFTYAD